MDKIKETRILALIGLICVFVGVITPYITFSILGYVRSLALWEYWEGKAIIVLLLANVLFIFRDYVEKYVPQLFKSELGKKIKDANPKLAIVPVVLIAAITIYMTSTIGVSSSYAKHGLGFYSLWIGVICLVGHTVFYKKKTLDNIRSTVSAYQQKTATPEQPQQVQPTVEQQNVKFCTNCGVKLDQGATRCYACGKEFNN